MLFSRYKAGRQINYSFLLEYKKRRGNKKGQTERLRRSSVSAGMSAKRLCRKLLLMIEMKSKRDRHDVKKEKDESVSENWALIEGTGSVKSPRSAATASVANSASCIGDRNLLAVCSISALPVCPRQARRPWGFGPVLMSIIQCSLCSASEIEILGEECRAVSDCRTQNCR